MYFDLNRNRVADKKKLLETVTAMGAIRLSS